jgi:hypothetical protein
MAQQEYPSINDFAPSWADIAVTFTVDGGAFLEMADIAAIKGARKVEVGEQRGASGGRVMARTTGSATNEASCTLYRSGLRKLMKALAAKAPLRGNQRRIGLVAFDILVQHSPPGETEIYTRKYKGCRFLGDSSDAKEGNDADQVEVTLNPIEIVDIVDGQEVVLL